MGGEEAFPSLPERTSRYFPAVSEIASLSSGDGGTIYYEKFTNKRYDIGGA